MIARFLYKKDSLCSVTSTPDFRVGEVFEKKASYAFKTKADYRAVLYRGGPSACSIPSSAACWPPPPPACPNPTPSWRSRRCWCASPAPTALYAAEEVERIDRVLAAQLRPWPVRGRKAAPEAEELEAEAPDTVRFTRALKDAVALEDRVELMTALWSVALADGRATMTRKTG